MPLACYSQAATREFWAEHWGGEDPETLLAVARRSPLTGMIERALPEGGPVLEAGCGLGQYVVLMRERGWQTVGADWSADALDRCRRAFPDTPLASMDLGALAVRAGTLAAYVSLGVLEHDPAGPARLLHEAHRVLAPGGRLVVSVPYLNGVRRLGARQLARRQRSIARAGGEFYQFVFTRRELRRFLEAAGFRVLSLTPYDPGRVLRAAVRRWRGRASIRRWRARRSDARPSAEHAAEVAAAPDATARDGAASTRVARLARAVLYTPPVLRLLGHMVLAVAVKA